jgi:hypothetical protein
VGASCRRPGGPPHRENCRRPERSWVGDWHGGSECGRASPPARSDGLSNASAQAQAAYVSLRLNGAKASVAPAGAVHQLAVEIIDGIPIMRVGTRLGPQRGFKAAFGVVVELGQPAFSEAQRPGLARPRSAKASPASSVLYSPLGFDIICYASPVSSIGS